MPYLLQGLLLGFSAAGSPGAFQAYLLSRALNTGWRRTWPAAFAPLISDGPVIVIVLLILSQVPDSLVTGLRALGGLFLLYLAWGAFRALKERPAAQPASGETGKGLLQAALMNLISPGPWLFWSTVVGPAFLKGWQQSPALGLAFRGRLLRRHGGAAAGPHRRVQRGGAAGAARGARAANWRGAGAGGLCHLPVGHRGARGAGSAQRVTQPCSTIQSQITGPP